MINYMKAEFYRILHKQLFFGVIGTYIALFVLLIFILFNPAFTGTVYVSKIYTFLDFFPLMIGLILFVALYIDELKSKSTQTAISYGLSRYQIIISKALECFTLLFIIAVCIILLVLITPIILGITISSAQALDLARLVFIEMFRTFSYISLSQFFIYCLPNITFALINYIALATQIIYIIMNTFLEQSFAESFGHLNQYLLTNELYVILDKGFITGRFLGILLFYVMIPLLLTIFLCQKRNIEC